MARRGVTKITGRVVSRHSVRENDQHPLRGMRPKERTDALAKTLGQVWFSVCTENRGSIPKERQNNNAEN